jgi:hypothetical protein
VRLEDKFSIDSDGNAVPDFIEQELGYDPKIDDCAKAADCPLPEGLPGASATVDQNVLVILDASGSMAGSAGGGESKIDAAKAAIERYVVGTPDTFKLGLMVYGHKGSNRPEDKAVSCAGIDTFAPLGQLKVDSVAATLSQFSPRGYTPVAASLSAARNVFAGTEGASNRVVMVTDGIETCDGDPVAAARALKESGIAVTVDVVGFDIAGSADEAALRQVAEVTGGTYTAAKNTDQLDTYFDELTRRQLDLLAAISCSDIHYTEIEGCTNDLSNEALSKVNELRNAEPDPERNRLLGELFLRINQRTLDMNELTREQRDARAQELKADLEETQRRLEGRYGQRVSLGVFCPWVRGIT